MTMPRFNVRFTLNSPSPQAFQSEIVGGICVEIELGQNVLWVKGVDAPSEIDARGRALEVANRVLDQIALEYELPLTILESPVATEYEGENGKKVRLIRSSDYGTASAEVAKIHCAKLDGTSEVRYPANEVVKINPSPYDCARFFRSGLAAEQLHNWFEAMREYFRAIEWIVTKWGEKLEVDGIAKVLCQCFSDPMRQGELKKFLLDACPLILNETQDLMRAVAKCLYVQHRNELDHAKALAGASYKRPFDPEAEEQVKKALPLARFVARELTGKLGAPQHCAPYQRNEAQESPERNIQGPGVA